MHSQIERQASNSSSNPSDSSLGDPTYDKHTVITRLYQYKKVNTCHGGISGKLRLNYSGKIVLAGRICKWQSIHQYFPQLHSYTIMGIITNSTFREWCMLHLLAD